MDFQPRELPVQEFRHMHMWTFSGTLDDFLAQGTGGTQPAYKDHYSPSRRSLTTDQR